MGLLLNGPDSNLLYKVESSWSSGKLFVCIKQLRQGSCHRQMQTNAMKINVM